jgi:LCP family protein required for cell wall assembly
VAASRSSATAAFLSFLWPGLGHWYVGRRRGAILFAAPAVLAALALLSQALGGIEQVAALLLVPTTALTVMILIILLGVWRLIALVDAAAAPRDTRRRNATVAVALAAVIVATHAWAGYVAWAFYDNGSDVFVGDNGPDATAPPAASHDPGTSMPPDDEYEATPLATPETDEARINVLLMGVDSAASRSTELTDTIMIASIDPETSDVALISFPRDLSNFPLWDGRTYRGKINSFLTWARTHPEEFPDGPLQSLVREIGFLLGAPVHYYAAIDLAGFRHMIDAVGGVEVEVEKALDDARYDWLDGRRGFRLSAGTHTLDGETALAYVRSRYSANDNDFNRARRQQQVLLSLRRALTDVSMLPRIPELVEIGGDTIRTNFPSDRVSEMLGLAAGVDEDSVRQVVLGPPYATNPQSTDGIYRLQLDMDRLARLSIEIFGDASSYASAPGASPGSSAP